MNLLLPLLLSPTAFMGFGFTEILLVGFVALLVFGGNLPDVMRHLGQAYGKLRRSLHELSQPVREELRQVREVPAPARAPTSYEEPEEEPDGSEDAETASGGPPASIAREPDRPAAPRLEEDDDLDEPPPV